MWKKAHATVLLWVTFKLFFSLLKTFSKEAEVWTLGRLATDVGTQMVIQIKNNKFQELKQL